MLRPVVTWRDAFQVNPTASAGTQNLAVSAGLSNGNFVVVWVDNTNNVDDDPGTDIIGQLYDPFGEAIGGPFQINTFATLDQETDPDIVALPNGEFMVVYEQNGNDGDSDIQFQRFDATGESIAEGNIALGAAGADQVRNPAIAFPSLEGGYPGWSLQVAFDRTSLGDTDVNGLYIGTLNQIGPEHDAAQNSPDFDREPDIAIIEGNGNIATVYEEQDGAHVSIELYIYDPAAGTHVLRTVTASGNDAHIAARTDDLMVVWEDANGNIRGRTYDQDGNSISGTFTIVSGAVDNVTSPAIVAIAQGYLVVWYNQDEDMLQGQRYGSDGAEIGDPFDVEAGASIARPELSLLVDGRVLVTWESGTNIFAEIIDPRDSQIGGSVHDDVITSRPDGATVSTSGGNDTLYGSAALDYLLAGDGDDTILGGAGNDVLNGGDGDDTIDGEKGNDQITGGAGNDTLNGEGGNDVFIFAAGFGIDSVHGGGGADTLDFSAISGGPGLVADLVAGTAAVGADTVDFLAVENIWGSQDADTLAGNASANILRGNAGNDGLSGRAGNDYLTGGLNKDTLTGGVGQDSFIYTAIADSGLSVANRDVITDFNSDGVGDPGNADTIDLSAIDANADGGAANDEFSFIGSSAFSAPGQVRFAFVNGKTLVEINTTGNTGVDMRIQLTGEITLDAADFVL